MFNRSVQYLSDPGDYPQEQHYLEVRNREGRFWSDETLRELPNISASSPFAQEWAWRARSLARLKTYILGRFPGASLQILDLGCGNGWMANQLAFQANWTVTAADLNQAELEQGARVFKSERLHFCYVDVLKPGLLPENHFDIIVVAASAQYFQRLPDLLEALRKLLKNEGEIHILDTPFYANAAAAEAAKERSVSYYTEAGVPEMAQFYHHHLWAEAEKLGAKKLGNTLTDKLLRKIRWLPPFPWLRFRKAPN